MSALFVAMLSMITANPTVTNLRCEYMARPLAVETQTPRLSWNTLVSGQNWRQSAYQVLVASRPELLHDDKGDLWDSGIVHSDASIQVEYKGKSLNSKQRVYWKVRVWDGASKESTWSKPQEFEM